MSQKMSQKKKQPAGSAPHRPEGHGPDAQRTCADKTVALLCKLGFQTFVVCPGARSIPLVAALSQRSEVRVHTIQDERSAAFCALGMAKAGARVVLITTSGSAVANLCPGLMEAHASGVAFVVLTADRPRENHGIGANQTADHISLLGSLVKVQRDVDASLWSAATAKSMAADIRRGLSLADSRPGPVHFNFRFRKPLFPSAGSVVPEERVGIKEDEYVPDAPALKEALALWEKLAQARKPLIVVGELDAHRRRRVGSFLANVKIPTIIDITSGLSRDANASRLRLPLQELPDAVLWLGGRLTFGGFGAWCQKNDVRAFRAEVPSEVNPNRLLGDWIGDLPENAAQRLSAWTSSITLGFVEDDSNEVSSDTILAEPELMSILLHEAASLPIFVGNSMPIRDADRFGPCNPAAPTIVTNRGVSGIDGQLSTAIGYSIASGKRMVVVVGDMTFAHDIGALAMLRILPCRLTVVLVQNTGGRIFEQLNDGKSAELAFVASWMVTTPDRNFTKESRGFGLKAERVSTHGELRRALHDSLQSDDSIIIEVMVDEERTRSQREAVSERTGYRL